MGDGCDVSAVLIEDMAQRQASGSGVMVATEVMQVPAVGPHRPMEPDRVIETDTRHVLIGITLIHGLMGGTHGVTGKII